MSDTNNDTAQQFTERLQALQSDDELRKIQRYFKTGQGQYGAGDKFMGVKMGQVFALAREYAEMPIAEIEVLLESPIHEVRAGALSIMDKAARRKQTPESRIREFFELYIRRHDRVNNWDLVDLGCLYMTGRHLFDKPRRILYKLAKSKILWERRSAIVSTCYFIRQGDVEDTYRIAEMLLGEREDLVQKAAGWMLRAAGPVDSARQNAFLDKYAPVMPRTMLRAAIEKLDKARREHYRNAASDTMV